MDGWGEYDLRGVGCLACDMIRLASLDLFSVLDTPVCFDQSNKVSTTILRFGDVACSLKDCHLAASSRDCGSELDNHFLNPGIHGS